MLGDKSSHMSLDLLKQYALRQLGSHAIEAQQIQSLPPHPSPEALSIHVSFSFHKIPKDS